MRLLYIILLLALSLLADFVFAEMHPWIELVWIIPISVTAIYIGPLEALGVSLLSLVLSMVVAAGSDFDPNVWITGAVGLYGAMAALLSSQVRRSYSQANIVRDALKDSPLAFAELSFPGYGIQKHNRSLDQFIGGKATAGLALPGLLPDGDGTRLSILMDAAMSGGRQTNEPEFKITYPDGKSRYWNINIVPVESMGRATPRAATFFASDVTDAVQRASNREAALRISAAVMSNLELQEILPVALESLIFIAGTNAGIIFLLEDDQWIGMAGAGVIDDGFARKLRLPYDDMPAGIEAVQKKRTLAIDDAEADQRIGARNRKQLSIVSTMVVPLTTGNRVIGAAWCVETERQCSFSDEQVEFATVVGSQVALAIENSSIYDNEYKMRKSIEAIEAISEAGLTSLDMEEVLIQLVTRTQDVMRMDAAMILLEDESGENLEVRAATGAVSAPLATPSVRIGEGLSGRAFLQGIPMKIDNVGDYDQKMCPFAAQSGIRSVLAVPLKVDGKTTGILQIGSLRERAFTASEWGLIQVLADRASHAVQNSMLHEQTRKELARAALLRDVAAACAGSRDMVSVATQALEAISRHLGCRIASIFAVERDANQLRNLASIGHPQALDESIQTIPLTDDTLLVRAVLEQKTITHDTHPITEASEAELEILRSLDALDNRRVAMPVMYRDTVLGGLALTMPGNHSFTLMELETFKSIADQLAVALHGDRPSRENGIPLEK